MTEKATRKLSNFNFDYEGAAVALVSKDQGGAANGRTVLLYKSTNKISEEELTKASQVTVTMSITEYLRKFFGLWSEDAEVLAKVFGYDTEDDSEEVDTVDWHDKYIQEKVDAVTIMKSLVIDKSQEEINKAVAELSPQDYLTILKSQEVFEKNFDKVQAEVKKSSNKPEGVTKSKGLTTPSVENNQNKEDKMSQDFISKFAMETALQEAITKALEPVQTELQKAKDEVATLKAEKQEVVNKARKEAIAKVEKDATAAEELFKSLEKLDEDAFNSVIKALDKKNGQLADSEIMKEVGDQGKTAVTDEIVDRTAEILKQQFKKGE